MVPVAFLVTVCIEAAPLIFHFSVAFVVARNIYYQVVPFTAAFYTIYLLQSYVDFFDYVMVSFAMNFYRRLALWMAQTPHVVFRSVVPPPCLFPVPFYGTAEKKRPFSLPFSTKNRMDRRLF